MEEQNPLCREVFMELSQVGVHDPNILMREKAGHKDGGFPVLHHGLQVFKGYLLSQVNGVVPLLACQEMPEQQTQFMQLPFRQEEENGLCSFAFNRR